MGGGKVCEVLILWILFSGEPGRGWGGCWAWLEMLAALSLGWQDVQLLKKKKLPHRNIHLLFHFSQHQLLHRNYG